MPSSSLDREPKIEFLAIAKMLLQVSPIILAALYVLEYTYVFQYLWQFGVTPEEVGISEIKLLTRAAMFTVAVVSTFGIVLALAVLWLSVQEVLLPSFCQSRFIQSLLGSVPDSGRLAFLVRRLGIVTHRRPVRSRKFDAMHHIRETEQRQKSARDRAVVSFALTGGLIIFFMGPLGYPNNALAIFADIVIVIFCVTLFFAWRKRYIRYFILATGSILAVSLLGWIAYQGGTNRGIEASNTGNISTFIPFLGMDTVQVHPNWIDRKLAPRGYKDQDLLELGSNGNISFLYACWTGTTYSIPLSDVVLTYSLSYNQTTPATLKRLDCS